MSSITFDSLEFVETLTKAGVPEAQAKAEAKAIGSAFKQITDSKELATKQDITVSESKIRQEMAELKSEILRAILLQTFAVAGLVIAVVKFMG
jgi:polyhydroxyalkanoate synthesis regulator phasin